MSVRSFADLDDIIIDNDQSSRNDDGILNSSYDEDVFENDSPLQEHFQSEQQKFGGQLSSDEISLAAPDYAGDCFETDEDHVDESYRDDADDEESRILNASDADDASCDRISSTNYGGILTTVPEDTEKVAAVRHSVQHDNGNEATMQSDDNVHKPVRTEVTAVDSRRPLTDSICVSNGSSVGAKFTKQVPNMPIIRQDQIAGKYLGNKISFSSIRKVSEDDAFILKQRKKQEVEREEMVISSRSNDDQRQGIVQSLEEMLIVAAEKMDMRRAAVDHVACRATRVPSTHYGGIAQDQVRRIMFCPERNDVFGIPDYDPDYDCALEMKEGHLIPRPYPYPLPMGCCRDVDDEIEEQEHEEIPLNRYEKEEKKTEKTNLKLFCEEVVCQPESRIVNHGRISNMFTSMISNPKKKSDLGDMVSGSVLSDVLDRTVSGSAVSNGIPIVCSGTAESVLLAIREGKVNSDLLRLGTDRSMLAIKAEDLHSAFLSDLLELCRSRSFACTSVEELAMHRALAEHVRDRFLGRRVVTAARNSMVATAVEVSLKYPPMAQSIAQAQAQVQAQTQTQTQPKPWHREKEKEKEMVSEQARIRSHATESISRVDREEKDRKTITGHQILRLRKLKQTKSVR